MHSYWGSKKERYSTWSGTQCDFVNETATWFAQHWCTPLPWKDGYPAWKQWTQRQELKPLVLIHCRRLDNLTGMHLPLDLDTFQRQFLYGTNNPRLQHASPSIPPHYGQRQSTMCHSTVAVYRTTIKRCISLPFCRNSARCSSSRSRPASLQFREARNGTPPIVITNGHQQNTVQHRQWNVHHL